MPEKLKEPPPILYKYCNERGLAILEKLKIKVTRPNEFNDPFEFTPVVDQDVSDSLIQDFISRIAESEDTYAEFQEVTGDRMDWEGFQRLFRGQQAELIALFRAKVPDIALDFQKEHQDMVSEVCAVLCLSEPEADILMWSHYANEHKGITVGISTDQNGLSRYGELLNVEYSQNRASIPPLIDPDPSIIGGYVREITRRKSAHWQYEHEWRQLHNLTDCEQLLDPKTNEVILNEKTKSPIYLRSLQPDLIKSVTLGCRCAMDFESKIVKLLSKSEFSHVTLKKAVVDDTGFKLNLTMHPSSPSR